MEILKIIDHDLKEHIKGFTLKILIMFSFAFFSFVVVLLQLALKIRFCSENLCKSKCWIT